MSERGDGRNIDERVAILSGEASGQEVPADRARAGGAVPYTVWDTPASAEKQGYYDRSVLKEPVWIWAVPAYFYAGGVAGAAAVLAGAAQLVRRSELEDLVRKGRRLGLAAGSVGTALLIYDLGRPERFLNMLRVFRPSSPLNVGSWILATDMSCLGAAVVVGDSSVGDLAGGAAALLGIPLSSYTAVLLSQTAVPGWQYARKSLPALFVASAVSSAASLLELGAANEAERSVVRRFGVIGKAAELAAVTALEREVATQPRVARFYKEGLGGWLWTAAKALTAASLGAALLSRRSRWARVASAVLGTAGGVAVRFAVYHAGHASTRDPLATFEPQRDS